MSANLARLNATIKFQFLYNKNKLLKAENSHLKLQQKDADEQLRCIEAQVGIEYIQAGDDADVENDEGEQIDDGGQQSSTNVKVEKDDQQHASDDALKSKIFKDLVGESFKILLGLQKLDAQHLPGYPMGIGEGTDKWPKDPATGKDLIRFDWRVGKHDDSINTAGLQRVVDRIRLVGPQMGDAMKGILLAILPGQIEKSVQSKYMRMAGEYRKADKKRKRVDEDDDLGDDVEIVDGGLDRAHMNSRVQSKLDAHKRKCRSNECDEKWQDPKYDSAFILNAMSDDEDDPEQHPGEARTFLTMEPEWRSLELSALFAAIDEVKDPRPDQAKLVKQWRRAAEQKTGPPPLARTLATHIHSWMVKTVILEENADWFDSGCVAHSGEAWGEEEPRELVKDRKGKGKAQDSRTAKKVIVCQRNTVNEASMSVLETAQQKLGKILEGIDDVDILFN
ncbi:uncharacterized protein BJ212DRAFT_1483196 [Suillus subaureus]|uniref:Uncharacterized protein n=1 Tax=Suillus subaureus TaxID=48587 RepID=A0A9P7JBE5_9AGAM|nr:uncharacterized protein BJ212DRAFT_1483196 [Suillus subaureus]KAG1812590.1 hypothetical protein BJ212DRAFT_1483196 [Suillus subaureus]